MNPLGNGNINNGSSLPPQLLQNIRQVKNMMGLFRGDPRALLQQNPQMAQVMQMCQGQNPETVFKNMCQKNGIDPDAFIKELRN